ncbi:MAG: hypothetical protein U1C49_01780 [Candidatus Andersenbacteria bacterium]|nr:hypothetical protein [bacterium]MDZ4225556.1 hypothetical protein [Candidatus Andersenbacteria bacterium]
MNSSKKIHVFIFPVVLAAFLPLAGCTTNTPALPPPGGTYLSTSAGAYFDQSVKRSDESDTDIASFNLLKANRPAFNPSLVYIAAAGQGIVKSEDGGQNWIRIGTPLVYTADVVALANGVIVAAGTDANGQGFVVRSIDNGDSWESVLTIPVPVKQGGIQLFGNSSATPQSVVISIAADPFHPDRVIAGTSLGNILVGEQSAKTWRTLYTLSGGPFNYSERSTFGITDIIASPHVNGEFLIITADSKLYRVNDHEQTEIKIPRDLSGDSSIKFGQNKKVLSASYISEYPNALFVGVDDGAVISRDKGANWEQLNLPVDTVQQFNTSVVAVSPTNSARMFVGINSVIYRSEDGGANWNTFTLGLKTHAITSFLIDANNAANVLLVTSPLKS